MPDAAFCSQCGKQRMVGARFCPSCGAAYNGSAAPTPPVAAPTVAPTNTVAAIAGVAWLVAAALAGYLAYQQWTYARLVSGTGLDPGGNVASTLSQDAAFNAVSAVVTLYFGAKLIVGPTRKHLGWSMAWAALDVILGVVQIGQGATSDIFAFSMIAAGTAGILSFAAYSASPEAPSASSRICLNCGKPIARDRIRLCNHCGEPFDAPRASPEPPIPSPLPALIAVMPGSEPIVSLSPQTTSPAVALAPPPPVPSAKPPVAATVATAPDSGRTSPALILAVLVTGLLALVVVGYALAQGPAQGALAGLFPTPTPTLTPTPTPGPTPSPSPEVATILFGASYDANTFAITAPEDTFKTSVKSIAWSVTLPKVVGSTVVTAVILGHSSTGAEVEVWTELANLSDPNVDQLAAKDDLAGHVQRKVGTYVMRLSYGGILLAQGEFALTN
jgi:hypothetical protein